MSHPVSKLSAPRLNVWRKNWRRSMPPITGFRMMIGSVIRSLLRPMRRRRGAAEDHRHQSLRHQNAQRDMDEEEGNNCRHAEEMHDPGELVAAKQPGQPLQLHRLPDAQTG